MVTQQRSSMFFFIAFFLNSALSFASSKDMLPDIPGDMQTPLTHYMHKHCPPISCGEAGHFLRSTTPDEYRIIYGDIDPEPPYKTADFFTAAFEEPLTHCLFSLYSIAQPTHPVARRTPEEKEEREEEDAFFYGQSVYSFFDPDQTFMGFIAVEPHKTTGFSAPHIHYYILKAYQGKRLSPLMIAGFVKHLRTLEGQTLPQIFLPKRADCLKILNNILATEKGHSPNQLSFSDIPSSQVIVGPIHAHVPLENPPSFVPASKALFFTGTFHLEPDFSQTLGYLIKYITPKETRAVGTWLFFSSQEPNESDFSPLQVDLMKLFKAYCTAKREDRPALYPALRDQAFAVVDRKKG